MYGSINGFNVADNLKKLINKKNHTVFIENPLGENMIEQSKQFFMKIYRLDPIKENIYRALLAKDQVNVL